MELKNKVIIVSGAGSGIGAATAKLLSARGAKIIASDIDLSKVEAVVNKITKSGGQAWAKQTDVTQFTEVEALVSETVADHKQIDVMVNNAGIGGKHQRKTAEHTHEDWHNVIAVNQTGVFYCMKTVLQQMMKQGYGNIINIASLAGLKPSGYNLSYSASKFAVVGMTKSAALEYGRKNIRINAICPGYTQSPLLDKLIGSKPEMGDTLKKLIPMDRFGEASEIAEAIAWLASDKTKYITGQTIVLDGGTSLI